MTAWHYILILTLMAGLAMPLGGLLASFEQVRPRWLETELRHSIIAFGGGALLAAVALVLVPEGIRNLHWALVMLCFTAGGLAFMALDIWLAKHNTSASQLIAMLADFIPEALALGATFTFSHGQGLLLALIIALQNIPEGFNAYREVQCATNMKPGHVILIFALMALLGPLAGFAGYYFLADAQQIVSGIMLFAAGGILYLIFQDIAPQVKLERHWSPPLGAIAGFLLGVVGSMAIGH